jgi:hypothetical protein
VFSAGRRDDSERIQSTAVENIKARGSIPTQPLYHQQIDLELSSKMITKQIFLEYDLTCIHSEQEM